LPYIGRQIGVGNFVKLDAITTSATATYNLLNGGVAYFPQTANNCIVSLNGVIQSPTSAYTISGSTIVFSDALTSNDTIDFILVLGDVLNIGTPSDGTVGFAKVTSNLITGATAETSIAGGDSILIYDDSATALRKMTRTNFIGGGNTPAFNAYQSTAQSISNVTSTIVNFQTEEFDTDNAFSSNRFTVPTGKGGKYFFHAQVRADNFSTGRFNAILMKNDAEVALGENASGGLYDSANVSIVIDLSATDYIEVKTYHDAGTAKNLLAAKSWTYFCGFKLI